jgi:hypothetical protein
MRVPLKDVEKVTKDINPENFIGTAEFADALIKEL